MAAAVAWIAAFACGLASGSAEVVVVDHLTGLAISGFDPVAYFADRAPLAGRPEFETARAGAVWRFRNDGNRLAFQQHPEIYAPQFGGYDAVEVAKGKAVAGQPLGWLVEAGRLNLSFDEGSRARCSAALRCQALAQWPRVRVRIDD